MQRLAFALLIWIVAIPAAAGADDQLVFSGLPVARVESIATETEHTPLSGASAEEYRVRITKRNGKYYWASRGGRELLYERSGLFHIFVDPGSAGVIKIVDSSGVPGGSGAVLYYETMSKSLGTITYWGTGAAFTP